MRRLSSVLLLSLFCTATLPAIDFSKRLPPKQLVPIRKMTPKKAIKKRPAQSGVTGPYIYPGGVINAASARAGKIARGSYFLIFGEAMGPTDGYLPDYPLPQSAADVFVELRQGSTTTWAYLDYVCDFQINAIMPSDAPLGDVEVTVSYGGYTSDPVWITVLDAGFGIYTMNGLGSGPAVLQNWNSEEDVPINTPTYTAIPGQTVIVWGTGLGGITTGDDWPSEGWEPNTAVEVMVGGVPASNILYAARQPGYIGIDVIYFDVPYDAPQGCSVPVVVRAGDSWSNTARMAIEEYGDHCYDTANPFGEFATYGGRGGGIVLLRAGLTGQLESGQAPVDMTLDLGLGIFGETVMQDELDFNPLLNLPPLNTCAATATSLDLASILGGGGGGLFGGMFGTQMDAGAELLVSGIKGTQPLAQIDPQGNPGVYLGLLGGASPLGGQQLPLFLEGGSFTVTGPGGYDVGAFRADLQMGHPLTWTNRSQLDTIYRSGTTVTWSGGDSSQFVLLAGASTDQNTYETGGFFCLAPSTAHAFTIPSFALADLPATGSSTGVSGSLGALMFISLPMQSQTFSADGLDTGFAFASGATVRTVQVR